MEGGGGGGGGVFPQFTLASILLSFIRTIAYIENVCSYCYSNVLTFYYTFVCILCFMLGIPRQCKREILSLDVYCDASKNGCPWIGPLKELDVSLKHMGKGPSVYYKKA